MTRVARLGLIPVRMDAGDHRDERPARTTHAEATTMQKRSCRTNGSKRGTGGPARTGRGVRMAARLARWGYGSTSASVLAAAHGGIDESRMRHLRTDEAHSSPLALICRAVGEVEDDDAARDMVMAVLASYEGRDLRNATSDVLHQRLQYLWEAEHPLDSTEDRACALWLRGESSTAYHSTLLRYGGIAIEIAQIIAELESRGEDPREALAEVVR